MCFSRKREADENAEKQRKLALKQFQERMNVLERRKREAKRREAQKREEDKQKRYREKNKRDAIKAALERKAEERAWRERQMREREAARQAIMDKQKQEWRERVLKMIYFTLINILDMWHENYVLEVLPRCLIISDDFFLSYMYIDC